MQSIFHISEKSISICKTLDLAATPAFDAYEWHRMSDGMQLGSVRIRPLIEKHSGKKRSGIPCKDPFLLRISLQQVARV